MAAGIPVPDERAAIDVDEFEFFLAFGMSTEAACARLGLSPRTVQRRYAQLDRSAPEGARVAGKRPTLQPKGRVMTTSDDDWVDPDDREMAMEQAIAAFNREFEQEAS